MTKEQEAQQAQTIAEIKTNALEMANADHETHTQHECRECIQDRAALLEIVDSQAQKIAELTKERDEARHEAAGYRDGYCAKSPVNPPLP